MYLKGIIMSITPVHAIAMCSGGEFFTISLKQDMCIGKTILFTSEDIIPSNPTKKTTPIYKIIVSVAAIFMLFFITSLQDLTSPYAVISLDINPSIELTLTKDGYIKNALHKNSTPIDLTTIKGATLEDALATLNQQLIDLDILKPDSPILIAYTQLKNTSFELYPILEKSLKNTFKDTPILVLEVEPTHYKEASKSNLSLGRYKASIILNSIQDNFNAPENIANTPVSDLIKGFTEIGHTPTNSYNFIFDDDLDDDLDDDDNDLDDNDFDDDDFDDNDSDDNDSDDNDSDDNDSDDNDSDDNDSVNNDSVNNDSVNNDSDDNDSDDNDSDDNDSDDNDSDDDDSDDDDSDDNDSDDDDSDDDDSDDDDSDDDSDDDDSDDDDSDDDDSDDDNAK